MSDVGEQLFRLLGGSQEVLAICPECSHTRRKKRDKCMKVTRTPEGGCVFYCHHCHESGVHFPEGHKPVRRARPPKPNRTDQIMKARRKKFGTA